ncbi:MAG: oxidoreductase [Armatimonadetes bacterium CG2_30_59_28]|nr:Gfo/Idh/MocA family oxidoreductase [Armatimonadota bacterium]OIO90905.1 MAG: oxidoreductase [Armatimonadetes bacterium CG2_30_59_28]PIU64182.1 MAG: oxidoreductase [Armatimonadetes bacterium CG07_land_8_20_14_0_80_59_28]PIX40899.1 MAG: oxidoreductase [Armatimonadetes bacterium CG_4_8_14_3_um_filter_58_9]PIY48090.1 MAG: oxidoreductase [Armatimonadetes bacterium CG_4_10_14_3_um_filter_59_10]PJB74020.1 MAG: oxidoreductase [Armatimonadetes bacterium CG_4_9_14_3_um_filter_58_7]
MPTLKRKLKMGQVGGGPGAFIGAVHRKAAALDGQIDLVAGCFASTAAKSKETGKELLLDPKRVYGSYTQMIEKEKALPKGERIDFVSIVTPNHVHHPVAQAFMEAGFNVVCDKPMTITVAEAEHLCDTVKRTGSVFALTHNYTGYPMVKEARELVRQGELGELRKVVVEYPQGWLATALETEGAKQAVWRTDPKTSGASGCIGDIGSHCENLVHYVTGLSMAEICADLTIFVPGRKLDDDGNILVRYTNGARGVLYASQISVGDENGLTIRVYGTKAGLEWHQEEPNYLRVKYPDGPEKVYKRGNGYLSPITQHNSRLPFGHPEAFIEAFANIYVNVANTIRAKLEKREPGEFDLDFPTVQDGARGVHFINKAVESAQNGAVWVSAEYTPPS